MTNIEFGALLFGICLLLIAFRMPVGVAMFVVGGSGFVSLAGWSAFLNLLNTGPFGRVSSYTLSVLPLFLLMGQFATQAGLSQLAVPGRAGLGRASPRRARHLDHFRLCGLRGDLRLVDRDRRDDGLGGAAGDEAFTAIPARWQPELLPPAARSASSSRLRLSW